MSRYLGEGFLDVEDVADDDEPSPGGGKSCGVERDPSDSVVRARWTASTTGRLLGRTAVDSIEDGVKLGSTSCYTAIRRISTRSGVEEEGRIRRLGGAACDFPTAKSHRHRINRVRAGFGNSRRVYPSHSRVRIAWIL